MAKNTGRYLGAAKRGKANVSASGGGSKKRGGRYSTRKMKSGASCPKPKMTTSSGKKVQSSRKAAKGKKTRPK